MLTESSVLTRFFSLSAEELLLEFDGCFIDDSDSSNASIRADYQLFFSCHLVYSTWSLAFRYRSHVQTLGLASQTNLPLDKVGDNNGRVHNDA